MDDNVDEYSISTAWDITTSSYVGSFNVSAQEPTPVATSFKPDGTVMYVIGVGNQTVYQYTLSTAWSVSTASYASKSFSVATQETNPWGLYFTPDGTKMFIIGEIGVDVNEYSLSTAWDVSTASYVQNFSVSGQTSLPYGLTFGNDGSKMYVVELTNDSIYQYSTATIPTITYPTNITWPSGTAPTSPAIGETDVITFTTRDGGTTYNAALAIDGAT